MELKRLNKHWTTTDEEHIAIVQFKNVEIQFSVIKTTHISTRGTSFTNVSIKKLSDKPNLTKGQKEKIREIIQQKLEI
jgi:hypothetical protein